MGLLKRLFGTNGAREAAGPPSSQFEDSETTTELSSRNAPRRELVQVVLRDTMRRHGIPSDWIECRLLSVMSARRGPGMHVQLVVRQGDDRLLTYVHAFQESFLREVEKFEPKASEWIFSLSWQFEGKRLTSDRQMPPPSTWGKEVALPAAPAQKPAARPARAPVSAPAPEPAPAEDAELEQDLKALFAIRDAVLKDNGADEDAHPEFAPTQPGFTEEDLPAPGSKRR